MSRMRANQRCQGQAGPSPNVSTACYTTGEDDNAVVWIGPNDGPGDAHNSEFKFVVAHELGHAVQDMAGALPFTDYASSISKYDTGYCGCAFVANPGDRSHCLQSQETLGIANAEGFAHFFATRVWNDNDPSSCTFVYYKNFSDPNAGLLLPPVTRSCATNIRWLENQCWANNRGTEWDWMNFERSLAVGSNVIGLQELLSVQRRACGGTNCVGQQPDFQQMATAAAQEFGPLSPKAVKFLNGGQTYGVDH